MGSRGFWLMLGPRARGYRTLFAFYIPDLTEFRVGLQKYLAAVS
jgi:hypothetical protein